MVDALVDLVNNRIQLVIDVDLKRLRVLLLSEDIVFVEPQLRELTAKLILLLLLSKFRCTLI